MPGAQAVFHVGGEVGDFVGDIDEGWASSGELLIEEVFAESSGCADAGA